MFQLIIAIISILLIVVLAAAAFFYGGDTFFSSSGKAEYSEKMNGASQIETALHLYLARNGRYPTGTSEEILSTLVNGEYLSTAPSGDWMIGTNLLIRPIEALENCTTINKHAGFDVETTPCPSCDDPAYQGWPACSSDTAEGG